MVEVRSKRAVAAGVVVPIPTFPAPKIVMAVVAVVSVVPVDPAGWVLKVIFEDPVPVA